MTKEKETKYVVAGTDEEVLLGDVISVDMVKDFKDGRTLTREMEFEITEESIPTALKLGIIEEMEDEDNELIDFDDESDDEALELIEGLIESIESLEKKVEEQKELIESLEGKIDKLAKKK